jgi:ubiquitin carboxyl-terminal hydrolase 25
MELAKLALVTSKDEEDDIEQTATDSSNDTDATLVEDALPRTGILTSSPVGSPGASSSSVLGKRSREKEIGSRMSIDSVTDKDNYVIISKNLDAGPSGVGGPGSSETELKDIIEEPEPAPASSGTKPPPLPPRKTSESVMMFGAILLFG